MHEDEYEPDDDQAEQDAPPAWIPPLTFWLVVVALVLSVVAGVATAPAPVDQVDVDPWLAGIGTGVLVLLIGSLLIIAASLEMQNRRE